MKKNGFERKYTTVSSRLFFLRYIYIVVWVETMASPPAAGGVAIPSRIGIFECPVSRVACCADTQTVLHKYYPDLIEFPILLSFSSGISGFLVVVSLVGGELDYYGGR